jgi:hypothetical protein
LLRHVFKQGIRACQRVGAKMRGIENKRRQQLRRLAVAVANANDANLLEQVMKFDGIRR